MYSLLDNKQIYLKQEIGNLEDLTTENKSSIVAAINEITFSGSVDLIARDMIAREVTRATAEDASLSSSIAVETQRAYEAEKVLLIKVSDETNARKEADNLINTSIEESINTVNVAINSLSENTDNSFNTVNLAISSLSESMNNSFNTVNLAINNLETYAHDSINIITNDLLNVTSDISNLNNYTADLNNSISMINSSIENVQTELSTEISNRETQYNELNTAIAQETVRALGVEANKANKSDTYTKEQVNELIESLGGFKFPKGYVYMQPYRTDNPATLGMQVPEGCAWVDISDEYSGDYFRVKNPRYHTLAPVERVIVSEYAASVKIISFGTAVLETQCWVGDIVRYKGKLAYITAVTTYTLGGLNYISTVTIDTDLAITDGDEITISVGDTFQRHRHKYTHITFSGGFGRGATSTYSSATFNTDDIVDWSADEKVRTGEETRVQSSYMTVWQVQEI